MKYWWSISEHQLYRLIGVLVDTLVVTLLVYQLILNWASTNTRSSVNDTWWSTERCPDQYIDRYIGCSPHKTHDLEWKYNANLLRFGFGVEWFKRCHCILFLADRERGKKEHLMHNYLTGHLSPLCCFITIHIGETAIWNAYAPVTCCAISKRMIEWGQDFSFLSVRDDQRSNAIQILKMAKFG